jgi:hypothetical protein
MEIDQLILNLVRVETMKIGLSSYKKVIWAKLKHGF